jgi:hypothetical protein
MVSGTLSSATFGDVADCMIGPRFDPVLKSKPSFYRIALQAEDGPQPLSGDMGRSRSARSRNELQNHNPKIYCPIPLA